MSRPHPPVKALELPSPLMGEMTVAGVWPNIFTLILGVSEETGMKGGGDKV